MKQNKDKVEARIAGMISINLGKDAKNNLKISPDFDMSATLVLPTRNLVLFPNVALPIQIGRDMTIKAAEYAHKHGLPLSINCQHDPNVEEPTYADIYKVGTLARIIDILDLPNGVKTAIVEGLGRVRAMNVSKRVVTRGVLTVETVKLVDKPCNMKDSEFQVIFAKIRELADTLLKNSFDEDTIQMQIADIDKIQDGPELINTLAVHLPLDVKEKQKILECDNIGSRAQALLESMLIRSEQIELLKDVMGKTRSRMEEGQRNAFLMQQMEVIREELSTDDSDDVTGLEIQAANKNLPQEVRARFDKEVRKLRRMNEQSPDYSVLYNYLETLLSLPWHEKSTAKPTLDARDRLLADHYGLPKVKERILEQIALINHNVGKRAPILCFVGPPGVGKTSLGQSIAAAMGREFRRISLGGLHDEAEIRGHRRTYIGAMPGRIIEAMRRLKTVNPVIMLDEIDKIGADYKGDPSAALLEVLDPEQNHKFHDNYIDVDYDLSEVMFIATANTLSTISKPLLDRIEIIELSGYTEEEKLEIARKHIIPKLRKKNNINSSIFSIDRASILKVIHEYTAESGVRQLEQKLEALMRKKLLQKMLDNSGFSPKVTQSDVRRMLGVPPHRHDKYEGNQYPGVVTGLAWTSVGGEILLVEAALAPGKGGLVLTGNLGDVMKESATLALEWVKVNSESLAVDAAIFKDNDIHIHFPEGAVPKDGPSAGITIATAIVSALRKQLLQPRVAMTGEITLRGKVLPVGGIKEKMLAAKRAGITHIILSEDNRRDIDDIDDGSLAGLVFIYVRTVAEVLDAALLPRHTD